MTARSKKRRMKNSAIKRERNKVKELKTLKRTVFGKNADELMEEVGDVVDEKTLEELKIVRNGGCMVEGWTNPVFRRNKQRSWSSRNSLRKRRLSCTRTKRRRRKAARRWRWSMTTQVRIDWSSSRQSPSDSPEFPGKTHNYNTRTLRDEFNSFPPWLNVGNHKRKIKRKRTAMLKNQFYTGAVNIGVD